LVVLKIQKSTFCLSLIDTRSKIIEKKIDFIERKKENKVYT
jgi:hypothetical protein